MPAYELPRGVCWLVKGVAMLAMLHMVCVVDSCTRTGVESQPWLGQERC